MPEFALRVRTLLPATPRCRIVRLGLEGASFPYRAGQAVLVGAEGQLIRKPYSIACSPAVAQQSDCLELLVQIDNGVPGIHLENLAAGSRVIVEGPLGSFCLPDNFDERYIVFVAGGTGIAPIRAMLQDILLTGHGVRAALVYSARSLEEFAYHDELQALAREGQIELRQTVTRADDAGWSGNRGRIDLEQLRSVVHDPATLCFVCGPPPLVADILGLLRQLGVSPNRIRMEEWNTGPVDLRPAE